jgi:ABC-type transport system involved in multi-copper enzyme maturation permease subunit
VYVAAYVLWLIAALVIAIQSTGLIGIERSRQTLDVLLTTPLSSDSIAREKFAGVWRMIRMLWIPFATVYLFQVWWIVWVVSQQYSPAIFGIVRGLLAMMIYLPLVAWLGFYFGMRCRSQTQATLITLSLIAGICLIPCVVSEFATPGGPAGLTILQYVRWISPATILSATTYYEYYYSWDYYRQSPSEVTVWTGMLVHFAVAGLLLILLWARGLMTFAYYVSRNDGQVVDDDDIDRLARLREHVVSRRIFRTEADEE